MIRGRSAFLGCAALLLFLGRPGSAAAQEGAEPCVVELTEVVRLGSDDGPGWRSLTSRVAGVEGHTFFVSPRYAPPQVSAMQRACSLPGSLADRSPGSDWEPRTVGAQDLGDGHLLLTSLVSDGEVPEGLGASTDLEPFLDTVLEVLDTRSGTLVAAHRSPEILEPVRGRPGLLFSTEETPSGNVEVVVSRVRLVCEP